MCLRLISLNLLNLHLFLLCYLLIYHQHHLAIHASIMHLQHGHRHLNMRPIHHQVAYELNLDLLGLPKQGSYVTLSLQI